jgi:hypothetical protein
MPEDFTLHSKYTGDESHGVKVVAQRPRSKKEETQMQTLINPDDVLAAAEEQMFGLGNAGFCLTCGEELDGIDPDARGDECECCGAFAVYGAQELVLMGYAG